MLLFFNSPLRPILVGWFLIISVACNPTASGAADNTIDNVSILADSLKIYAESYQKAYNSCGEKDSFIFFSDPHLLGFNSVFSADEKRKFESSFESMRSLYALLPMEFCLCGGDWLNNRDTQKAAEEKMLYADGKMKEWFRAYYKIMGNHDYNYQGVVSTTNSNRGDFALSFINENYYSEVGRAYYSIQCNNMRFLILDSGIDWDVTIDNYRREQLEWLSTQLQNNVDEHLAIGVHMLFGGRIDGDNLSPMSRELLGICRAFNRRERYESAFINSDFEGSRGSVHFIICGHNHVDFVYNDFGIPCVGSTRLIVEGRPSYDLCLVDFENGFLQMIRVGFGSDRSISLANCRSN